MIGSQKCYKVNQIGMSIIIGSIWEGGDLFRSVVREGLEEVMFQLFSNDVEPQRREHHVVSGKEDHVGEFREREWEK